MAWHRGLGDEYHGGVMADDSPSSRRLDLVPQPDELQRRCQALALLEAGLNRNPSTRWHVFGSSDDQRTCRVSDGSGNEAMYWFRDEVAVIRGFDHESPITPWAQEPMALWPGIYETAPSFVAESPTIEVAGVESVTFCFWWSDGAWRRGPVEFPPSVHADPDGSEYLLKPVASVGKATAFLGGYYERAVDSGLVGAVFEGQPIEGELLAAMAIDVTPGDLVAEASRIGYPVDSAVSDGRKRRRWFKRS